MKDVLENDWWNTNPELLTLSQTSPGFYMSTEQAF